MCFPWYPLPSLSKELEPFRNHGRHRTPYLCDSVCFGFSPVLFSLFTQFRRQMSGTSVYKKKKLITFQVSTSGQRVNSPVKGSPWRRLREMAQFGPGAYVTRDTLLVSTVGFQSSQDVSHPGPVSTYHPLRHTSGGGRRRSLECVPLGLIFTCQVLSPRLTILLPTHLLFFIYNQLMDNTRFLIRSVTVQQIELIVVVRRTVYKCHSESVPFVGSICVYRSFTVTLHITPTLLRSLT